mmetsp:Transcript_30598/g.55801  ORF Transcript_30598/g.55801 Transcript_30598/m.55801 type:complete len:672 (+) Transcript_30598:77-2092(+)
MVRLLVPLHLPDAEPIRLPREGVVKIGRKPENHVVCPDIAVSGQHCLVHCQRRVPTPSAAGLMQSTPALEVPVVIEVQDCSTNGTFVNERRLTRQGRQQVSDGDVISLTKPPSECEGLGAATAKPRVQFRLEVNLGETPPEETPEPEELTVCGSAQPVLASVALLGPGKSAGSFIKDAEGFAQDLLVQEQQSKAKITGELLLAKRRLDEERSRGETLSKELRKVRAELEEERSRRTTAQDRRDRLETEAPQLRADRRELQELRNSFETLQDRCDSTEAELTAQVQRSTSLEASVERSRSEVDRAQASGANMQQQLEEMQGRLQRAQASGERLNGQRLEARTRAERAKQRTETLQREVGTERSERERLEDQQVLLRAELERAETSKEAVNEVLQAAISRHSELEGRATTCREGVDAARRQAQEVQLQQEAALERAEALRGAASRFGEALRQQVDSWIRGLSDPGSVTMAPMSPPGPANTACAARGPAAAAPASDALADAEGLGAAASQGTVAEPVQESATPPVTPSRAGSPGQARDSPQAATPQDDVGTPHEEAQIPGPTLLPAGLSVVPAQAEVANVEDSPEPAAAPADAAAGAAGAANDGKIGISSPVAAPMWSLQVLNGDLLSPGGVGGLQTAAADSPSVERSKPAGDAPALAAGPPPAKRRRRKAAAT